MAADKFGNAFWTRLAAPMLAGDLTATVAVAAPAALQGGQFRVVRGTEIMIVTGGETTTTWTVTRGAEGTTPIAHATGAIIAHLLTAVLPAEVVDARGGYATLGAKIKGGKFDIRDYGALTSAANNVVAIQAALDAQKAAGGVVYIPEGTFLTSPLTYVSTGAPLHMAGAGRTVSILKPVAGTGTVLTLSGPMVSSTFRGFKIDGTGGTGHGIYYSGTTSPDWLYESAFEDLIINSCALNGLYIKNSFANRYVNISAGANGQNQIKVWGGPGDHYERIDINSTVTGYGGIRAIDGGTFVSCNGIYDTVNAVGPMFKFGGDGTAESDSITRFPQVHVIGSNVEAFATTGILFVNSPVSPVLLDGVIFQTASGVANCRAIDEAFATDVPLIMSGCRFALIGGATWANGYAIHGQLPGVATGAYAADAPTGIWSDVVAYFYPITQRLFGTGNVNTEAYLFKRSQLAGMTDIEYLASARLGNNRVSANYVDRTAAAAKPTAGTYRVGDIVDNCSHTITEQGTAGSKYTLTGWRRLTDGSAHVLNTDWVERRELTGN